MAKDFISGLIRLGGMVGGNPESFLGIYSQNRLEWLVAAIGCWMMSNSIVPLYDTLGPSACSFIINQTELTSVLCDTNARGAAQGDRLGIEGLPLLKSRLHQFRIIWNSMSFA